MRKIIALAIMLLFLGMTISSTTGLYLEKQSIKPLFFGNILYVGGNGSGNYTKIQDAIDNASDGDTVFVYDDSSPYYENLIVNKSVTLKGENKVTTVINGTTKETHVLEINSDGVNISGFMIQGNKDFIGISIIESEQCIVDNNIINLNFFGVLIYNSSFIQILNNSILNSKHNGIYFINSNNCISNNNFVFENGLDGILAQDSSFIHITNNKIQNNSIKGVYLMVSNNCTVNNNSIFGNGWSGIGAVSSLNSTIGYNQINWNRNHGIGCSSCGDLFVYNNTIIENYHNGIEVFNCYPINISDNNIYKNQGHGIKICPGSANISGNRIADNNHSGIHAYAVFSLNVSWNNISGNKKSGLYSHLATDSTFTANRIEKNSEYGIYLDWGYRNNISYNIINRNGDVGCYLNFSRGNNIISNTFIDNHRDAYFSVTSSNIWDGNYWGRPRILPKLILGEIDFPLLFNLIRIPWINIDWHPAQAPYDIGV